MELPNHIELSGESLGRVAEWLDERPDSVQRLEDRGICNARYRIGTRYVRLRANSRA